jgi:hypothetical protein
MCSDVWMLLVAVQLTKQALLTRTGSYEDLDEKHSMDLLQGAVHVLLEPVLDHMANQYLEALTDIVLRAKADATTQEAAHKIKAKLEQFRILPLPVKLAAWGG